MSAEKKRNLRIQGSSMQRAVSKPVAPRHQQSNKAREQIFENQAKGLGQGAHVGQGGHVGRGRGRGLGLSPAQSPSEESSLDANKSAEEQSGQTFSGFKYEETNQVEREIPEVKFINTPGKHLLSTDDLGDSWITYNPNFLSEELGDHAWETLSDTSCVHWEQKYNVNARGEKYPMPRQVAWYGPLPYTYAGATMEPCNEWPQVVLDIHEVIKKNLELEFNSVLLNYYESGFNSVAWHSDDEMEMGVQPTIASISLGTTRMFEMRKKPPPEEEGDYIYMQHWKIPLDHRNLLVMDGCTQLYLQHRIPKSYHDVGPRINLTFRNVFTRSKEEGK